MSCNRFSSEDYAFYALGTLDGPEREVLRAHVAGSCETCIEELRRALEFWYIFAALTERTQAEHFPEPRAVLRDRVLSIARPARFRRTFRSRLVKSWIPIAAGIALAVGTGSLTWGVARARTKREAAVVQAHADQQTAALKKLEAENNSLRNLVVAAKNAPAVFPGRDSIVSVQDPNLLRDLQSARQTQVAISQALAEERIRETDLEKRLSQTTTLLAAATRDREDADRKYRKAFDTASIEKDRGVNQLSTELASYKTKIHTLESEIARYRTTVDSQSKEIEQHQQMISLLQSDHVSFIQLRPAEAGTSVSGVALIADNSRLVFFPANLPPARAGYTYQLWLLRDKAPAMTSAGTFNGVTKNMLTIRFDNKELVSGLKGIAITEEPTGGSPQPTGHKVMTGAAPRT